MLDYQYFRDHYQLIAVDISKQKELDTDPRAIQHIEFYGKLGTTSQVCTILEKSKEIVLEFYKGTAKVLSIYIWLNTLYVRLSDLQLNQLETTVKNQRGVTLRMNIKMSNGNNLPHELLLTTRQTNKL